MKLLENGTYPATLTGSASIYEKQETGSLSAVIEVMCEGHRFTVYNTLYSPANGVSTKTIENLRKIFPEWDGQIDSLYTLLVENQQSFMEREVDVVIENEMYKDKESTKVKYLNAKGGGSGAIPQAVDKASMLTKYGSKFRAVSGGAPAKKPAVAAAPAKPKTAPAPAAKVADSTQEIVWEAVCKKHAGKSDDEINMEWFALIKSAVGKDAGDELTPQDYGKMLVKV